MPQAASRAPSLPLFQPGGLVREQARVTPEGLAPPTFQDVYTLDEQPLGEGRYSRVFSATHRTTGARRAIKTAYRRGENCTADVGMLCPGRLARHEADILKTLDHPNVIRLYEVYEEADAVHLVLELCEGGDVLERILVSKGRLTEHEISHLFVQMLFATTHLHSRGVIHRDLKPEHFLFTRREPDREPNPPRTAAMKVIDFGLSHADGQKFVPLGGTPQFMPPEILHASKAVQQSVPKRDTAEGMDMWALGVVLHAMLVGHYPSPHLNDASQAAYFAKSAWASTSKECLDLLGKMLRQRPEDRPTSATALQHPWAQTALAARGLPSDGLVAALPAAIKAYYAAPGLQRIVLLAVAHETDDFDYYGLRLLFQMLTQSGKYKLTLEALSGIAGRGGLWSKVAASLAEASGGARPIYRSGGGPETVADWKDFLAAALLAGPKAGGGSPAPAADAGLPPVSEGAVWRAFDALSLSSGEVTGASLRRLLEYAPSGPLTDNPRGTPPPPGQYARPEALDGLVQELFPRGGPMTRSEMMPVLAGEIKPAGRPTGGGGGFDLLACFKCGKTRDDEPADTRL